ncbi:hypothetical protein I8J29_19990 [Paenibacillus sp. MWE-103]|uniref:Uncharacterized protein n=1 Tax=Paenibacillus artemisiicola TaxID=1172618 RepID=A0ABS3WDV3_9BACL|nr:hypothetical protein [Paenibacillus artemisiicola]MBO7746499.1 hypothetical protein [Paenibacillus artemisiicola]
MMTKEQWNGRWVDDYLDLYNFAGAIGDRAWQAEIVEELRQKDAAYDETVRERTKEQLWLQFNAINYKMMELFALMRQTGSTEEESAIRDLIWQLKLQRMDLAKQIKELC